MKSKLGMAAGSVAIVAACLACAGNHGSDNTNKTTAVDTAVTTTPVKDTTVVKHDTTVQVDTLKKTGHGKKARQH